MVQYATPARGIRENILPKGCIIGPRASNTAGGPEALRAVLEARGQIMQPEGSIMWPVGGIFSHSRGQGWHINIITWQGRYFVVSRPDHIKYAAHLLLSNIGLPCNDGTKWHPFPRHPGKDAALGPPKPIGPRAILEARGVAAGFNTGNGDKLSSTQATPARQSA